MGMDPGNTAPLGGEPVTGTADDPALGALVERWISSRRARGKRTSTRTEMAYRSDLALLAQLLGDQLGRAPVADNPPLGGEGSGRSRGELDRVVVSDLTDHHLEQVLSTLTRRGVASSSHRRYLSAWRNFAQWCVREGLLSSDPLADFSAPAAPERFPVAFSDEELSRIIQAARRPAVVRPSGWPRRDVALVAVLAGCGVRAGELCGAQVGDLDARAGTWSIRGKGGKRRVVPMAEPVIDAVEAYLGERRSWHLGGAPGDPLFIRRAGAVLDVRSLDRLVEHWLEDAGVPRRQGEVAHAFRHTFGVGHVRNGTSVATLRQLLGHADLSTTTLYLRMSGTDLADSVDRAPVVGLLSEPTPPARGRPARDVRTAGDSGT